MERWIEGVIDTRRRFSEACRFNNRDFELNGYLFRPSKDWACDIGYVEILIYDKIISEANAEQLRKSIVDEVIPLEQKLLHKDWRAFWDGGRRVNAILLGEIKYHEALPELREAALHDLSFGMRRECFDSIGLMGGRARNLTRDLGRALLNPAYWTKDCCKLHPGSYGLRGDIADAFVKIEDIRAVPCLIEAGEGIIYELAGYCLEDYGEDKQSAQIGDLSHSLERIARALLKLDYREGRRLISKGESVGGDFVIHHLKSVVTLWDNLHMHKGRTLWTWNKLYNKWSAT